MTLNLDALEAIAKRNIMYPTGHEFGSAFNPKVVLAMIAEIRRLTDKVDVLQEERDDYRYRLNKQDMLR